MSSSSSILTLKTQQGNMAKRSRRKEGQPAPDSTPTPATLSRREALSLVALFFVALNQAQQMEISEELTPGSVAWSRIPEEQQLPHYRLQQWVEPGAYEVGQARRLRVQLSRLSLYRPFCHPPHPVTASKYPTVEANQRAALHELVDQLSQADTDSLFQIARLFSQVPADSEALASSQAGSCQVCNPPWDRTEPAGDGKPLDELTIKMLQAHAADMMRYTVSLQVGQGGAA